MKKGEVSGNQLSKNIVLLQTHQDISVPFDTLDTMRGDRKSLFHRAASIRKAVARNILIALWLQK